MSFDNMSRFYTGGKKTDTVHIPTEQDAKLYQIDAQRGTICKKISEETYKKACDYADTFGLIPCAADDPQRAVGKIVGCKSSTFFRAIVSFITGVDLETGDIKTESNTITFTAANHIGEWITRGGTLYALGTDGIYYLAVISNNKVSLVMPLSHTKPFKSAKVSSAYELTIQWYK